MNRHRLMAVLGVVLIVSNAFAEPAQSKRAIEGLLKLGWTPKYSARKTVDEAYGRVKANGLTANVAYAYVLAKIKQRQYRQAREALDDARRLAPNDLFIHRTHVWLDVVMRKFEPSLMQLDKFAGAIAKEYQPFAKKDPAANANLPLAEGDKKRSCENFARFTGVVMAYLDHPYSKSVNAQLRQAVRQRIEQRYTAPQLQRMYQAGYTHVVDEFIAMGRQMQLEGVQAKRILDEEKTRAAADVKKLTEDLKTREDAVRKRQEKLTNDLDKESKKLQEADEPLREGMRVLERRAFDINRNMSFVAGDLARARARHRNARNEFDRDIWASEVFRLSAQLSRLDADLLYIQRQAQEIHGERIQLARQDQFAKAKYRQGTNQNRASLADVQKSRKRSETLSKRLNRKRPNEGRVRAIEVKVKALATYDPFPIELERLRLLEIK